MKIIDQAVHSFQETPTDFEGCLRLIEKAARTCYGSKPSEDIERTRRFVEGLIKRGHLSVLRHSNLVLPWDSCGCKYLTSVDKITGGNWQAWMECDFRDDTDRWLSALELEYHPHAVRCPPELKRYTAHITTSIQNTRQLIRHTTLAVSERSTRYCDNSNLEVIKPWWWEQQRGECRIAFNKAMISAQDNYERMISEDLTKEDAAMVLPLDTATEMWITGDRDAWLNVWSQRLVGTTGKPSRQMVALMEQIDWSTIV